MAVELLQSRWHAVRAGGGSAALNRRLYECIRDCIMDGSLPVGGRLPASRDLAAGLNLSRNTVTFAYDQLRAEGYLRAVVGSGTFVTDMIPEAPLHAMRSRPMPAAQRGARLSARGKAAVAHARAAPRQWGAFMPGVPDVTLFPHRKLGRIIARLRRQAGPELLSYAPGGGHGVLQRSLAQYLRQARSVVCEPEQIIVTEGVHQAIDLIVRLLADVGDTAWVEEPGYWGIRSVLAINGIVPQPVLVDQEGMRLPAPGRKPPRLAFVTPSHQYPLGPVMSMSRRLGLLARAGQTGTWIVEDDYDSEFRFSGQPVPSLQGMAPDGRVIYVGTFSKTLYPGLRTAYMVVPRALADTFKTAQSEFYRGGHLLSQLALAEFIDQGYYASHIRRMRQVYAGRRNFLLDQIRRWLGLEWVHPYDTGAGLHLVLRLPEGCDDHAVEQVAFERNVLVRALSRYYIGPRRQSGLLMGFASVPEAEMLRCFQILLGVLRAALAPSRAAR